MKYPNIAASLGWTEITCPYGTVFLEPEDAAKIEKVLAIRGSAVTSSVEIAERDKKIKELEEQVAKGGSSVDGSAARDKRIKDLEAQVAAFSKPNGNKVTGKQASAIDFSFIDKLTGARKRAAENQPGSFPKGLI